MRSISPTSAAMLASFPAVPASRNLSPNSSSGTVQTLSSPSMARMAAQATDFPLDPSPAIIRNRWYEVSAVSR